MKRRAVVWFAVATQWCLLMWGLMALWSATAYAQIPQVAIRDTLLDASTGGPVAYGKLEISWPQFTYGAQTVPAARIAYPVVNGVVYLSLTPTDQSVGNVQYKVVTTINGASSTACWSVPSTGAPFQISQLIVPCSSAMTLTGGGGSSSVSPSNATPAMDGTASAGLSANYSRGDHVHPTDTSRQAAITTGTVDQILNGALGLTSLVSCSGAMDYSTISHSFSCSTTWPWASLSGVPSSFTPSAHASTHAAAASDPLSLSMSQISGVLPHAQLPTLVSGDIPNNAANTSGSAAAFAAAYIDWDAVSGGPFIQHKPTIPAASSATPAMDGTAVAGSSANYTRADHVHPTDTSRQAAIATGTVDQILNGTLGLTSLVSCSGAMDYSTISHSFSCLTTWPWASLSGVPSSFTPSAHASTHAAAGSDPLSLSMSQVSGTLPHSQLPTLQSADIPNNAANTSGNAATATALAGTPTTCSAGNYALGIAANGNATGCTPATGGGGTVTHSTGALTANYLLIGNGGADAAVSTAYMDSNGVLHTPGGFTSDATGASSYTMTEGSAPSAPVSGQHTLFWDSTAHFLKSIDASSALLYYLTAASLGTSGNGVKWNANGTLGDLGFVPQAAITTGTQDQFLNGVLGLGSNVNCAAGAERYSTTTHTWTCNTITSGDVDSSVAQTGADINTSNQVVKVNGAAIAANNNFLGSNSLSQLVPRTLSRAFGYSFNSSSALTAGLTAYGNIPFACTISAWTISLSPADTATVDVWKVATGTAVPTVSNTITASATPAISTGTSLHSTTLTGWTTSVSGNDVFAINLKAVGGTATFVNLTVECDQ